MGGVEERVKGFLENWRKERVAQGEALMGMSLNDWIDEEKRQRMVIGEKKHGPLDLDRDPRDFIKEGIEELIDFLNYLEIAMLQGKLPFCKWASIDQEIRFTIFRLTGGEG